MYDEIKKPAGQEAAPTTGYAYNAPLTANVPPENNHAVVELERQNVTRWRRRAFYVFLMSVGYFLLSGLLVRDSNHLDATACCIPQACDASKVKINTTVGYVSHDNPVCAFTREQMREMRCEELYDVVRSCHVTNAFQCRDTQARGFLIGTYASQFSTAAVLLFLSLCFFSIGHECFGSPVRNKTCGNWCARVTAGSFWTMVIAAVLTSLVFSSLVASLYNNRINSYVNGCISNNQTVQPHDSHHKNHNKCNGHQQRHTNHWAPAWTGDKCLLKNQVAYTFNAIWPTVVQRSNTYASVCANVCFVVFNICLLVLGIRSCCCSGRGSGYQQNYAGYNEYVATNNTYAQPYGYNQQQMHVQQQQQAYTAVPQTGGYGSVAPAPEKPAKTV